MRQFLIFLLSVLLLASIIFFLGHPAEAETVYVSIREGTYLNGRMRPSTRSCVTMRLFNGDSLEVVSFDGEWVQVVGGESGTSYVKAEYLSELSSPVKYTNVSGGRVRIRKAPSSSKAIGWVGANQTILVSRQISGWGYYRNGWVDLSYFQPE